MNAHLSLYSMHLRGRVQFEWGLFCHSPQMGFNLLLVALIVRIIQVIVITWQEQSKTEMIFQANFYWHKQPVPVVISPAYHSPSC